jgi:hypothetical protein
VVVGAAFLAGAAGAGAGAGAGVWAETSDARNVAPSAVTAIKAKTRPRGQTGAANIRKFIAENPF